MSENRDVPMIEKHKAESQMMHMSWTIRWLVIAIIIGFLCMVGMAYVFVTAYTARTKDWLSTYDALQRRLTVTEVANEKEETGTFQQLPVP